MSTVQTIYNLLPQVHQTPFNKSFMNTVVERTFSESDSSLVHGTIGKWTDTKDVSHITSNTSEVNAFQLQPYITTVAGEVLSFHDILRIAEQQNYNVTNSDEWFTSNAAVWNPPVSMDKLANYSDYFWVDYIDSPSGLVMINTKPDYIAVQNPINVAVEALMLNVRLYESISLGNSTGDVLTIEADIFKHGYILRTVNEKLFNYLCADTTVGNIIQSVIARGMLTNEIPYIGSEYTFINNWSPNNHWIHKSAVTDFTNAQRAVYPIIEYSSEIDMISWAKRTRGWKYRDTIAGNWVNVDVEPSVVEMGSNYKVNGYSGSVFLLDGYAIDTITDTITITTATSLTSNFIGTWNVVSTWYDGTTKLTHVSIDRPIRGELVDGLYASPLKHTSRGDLWMGFTNHWMVTSAVSLTPSISVANLPFIKELHGSLPAGTHRTMVPGLHQYDPFNVRIELDGVHQVNNYSIIGDALIFNAPTPIDQTVIARCGTLVDTDAKLVGVLTRGENNETSMVNLTQYRFEPQSYQHSTYPLFAGYTLTGEFSNPINILRYIEDTDAQVDRHTSKRLKRAINKNVFFETDMVGDRLVAVKHTDGQLQTVWTVGGLYRPATVDKFGHAGGEIKEIPASFKYNMHHETPSTFDLSEIYNHANMMIDSKNMDGTIKQYRWGIDKFISILLNRYGTMSDVFEFVTSQRTRDSQRLVQYATNQAMSVSILKTTHPAQTLANQYLAELTTNSYLNVDVESAAMTELIGVGALVPTPALLGLVDSVRPEVYEDYNSLYIRTHDNTILAVPNISFDNIVKQSSQTGVHVSDTQPTSPEAGSLWADTTTNTVKHFAVSVRSNSVPDPKLYAIGDTWFSPNDRAIYVRYDNYLGWTKTANTVESMWIPFNFTSLVAETIMLVETMLYDKCPSTSKQIELHDITSDVVDVVLPADPFTWNFTGFTADGASKDYCGYKWIYADVYGTDTPHITPWILQGFKDKPTWWDAEYRDPTGVRIWVERMWINIKAGIVPTDHRAEVTWTIKTYSKVSVNTTNTRLGKFRPDSLLPPYGSFTGDTATDNVVGECLWNSNTMNPLDVVKSTTTFGQFSNASYDLNRMGSTRAISSIRMAFFDNPVHIIRELWGHNTITVMGVEFDAISGNMPSHTTEIFGDKSVLFGLGDWYSSFFRYHNVLDVSGNYKDEFRNWTSTYGHECNGLVIADSISAYNEVVSIALTDFEMLVKRTTSQREIWFDTPVLTMIGIPQRWDIPSGQGVTCGFKLHSPSPLNRPFKIARAKKTTFDYVGGGVFRSTLNIREFGWNDGTEVVFQTGYNPVDQMVGVLPAAIDPTIFHKIRVVDNHTFMVYPTELEYSSDMPLILADQQVSGVVYVGELKSTFDALRKDKCKFTWYHYDTCDIIDEVPTGSHIYGLQNVVDFVDGLVAYGMSLGLVFNDPQFPEYDIDTGLTVTWQLLVEKFINTLYGALTSRDASTLEALLRAKFAINAMSHNVWVNHEQGVISEFTQRGPKSIKHRCVIYDALGIELPVNSFAVLRTDDVTQLTTTQRNDDIINALNVDLTTNTDMCGIHIMFDQYSHVMSLAPVTTDGVTLYDDVMGVWTETIDRLAYRADLNDDRRYNVSGYIIVGNSVLPNITTYLGFMETYYDTHRVDEGTPWMEYGRDLLGYHKADYSFMDVYGVSEKTKMNLHRGLIQHKGTLNSLSSLMNIPRVGNIVVDEFWAVNVGNFGIAAMPEQFGVLMSPEDVLRGSFRYKFSYADTNWNNNHRNVNPYNQQHWFNYPSIAQRLSGGNVGIGVKHNVVPYTIGDVGGTRYLLLNESANTLHVTASPAKPNRTITHIVNGHSKPSISVPGLIPGTGLLVVKINGADRTVDGLYTEYVNSIKFDKVLEPGQVVTITVGETLQFIEGVHFTRVNDRTIKLLAQAANYVVTEVAPDIGRYLPLVVYDASKQMDVASVPYWDPARGVHHPQIDMYASSIVNKDPAQYNDWFTPQHDGWMQAEVGRVWIDSTNLRYKRYNNESWYPGEQRYENWGKLIDGYTDEAAVYTWKESLVSPTEYAEIALIANSADYVGRPKESTYFRTRKFGVCNISGNSWYLTDGDTFNHGDQVFVNSYAGLPDELKQDTPYTVKIHGGLTFLHDSTGAMVALSDTDDIIVYATMFNQEDWNLNVPVYQTVNAIGTNWVSAIRPPAGVDRFSNITLYINDDVLTVGDVFIDHGGYVVFDQVFIDALEQYGTDCIVTLRYDAVGVPVDGVVSEVNYDPIRSQIYTGYRYTTRYVQQPNNTWEMRYYFWVRWDSIKLDNGTTPTHMESLLYFNDSPYSTVLDYVPGGPVRTIGGVVHNADIYQQVTLHNISHTIDATGRYVMWMRDNPSLRDEYNGNSTFHHEWMLVREGQQSQVPLWLWMLVVDSMTECRVNGDPIPSPQRKSYDARFGTVTRFGVGKDQIMADTSVLFDLLLQYLYAPTLNMRIDIDSMLETYDLTSPVGLRSFLIDAYNTFDPEHINAIFFMCLHQCLATGADLSRDIFKTSAVSIQDEQLLYVRR